MKDAPIAICPECSGSVKRLLYPVGIVFKGSGWYINDSRKPEPKSEGSTSDSSADNSEKSTSEKTAAEKTSSEKTSSEKTSSGETKPAAATASAAPSGTS